MWNLFAEPDTILVFKIFYEVFEDGIRLAMPKTIYALDSSSLKPGSGATEESWIRGCPDSRIISFGRTVGLSRYKIEDFVPCPDGILLCVEGKTWQFGCRSPSL